MAETIRVFVGGGREHWLPTKVLEHSILQNTSRPVEVTPLLDCGVPMPDLKTPTSFSLQRFMIPEALGFTGQGIYLDSDMVVKGDIGDVWDSPYPNGAQVETCHDWQSAVMLIDARIGWKVEELAAKVRAGDWKYHHLSALKVFPKGTVANCLPRGWNCLDKPCEVCHLLHYTGMRTQPWLFDAHPYGSVWTNALMECLRTGWVTREDVLEEIERRHVRPSLALLIGEEQPYEDAQFVFPDDARKAALA